MRQRMRIEAVRKAVRRISKLRRWRLTRWSGIAAAFCMVAVQLIPTRLGADGVRRIDPNAGLAAGHYQALSPAMLQKVRARQAEAARKPDVRRLSTQEMRAYRGAGSYRSKCFQGVLPWQRSLRDVNLCTGNLFKSFTDIQVQPARGAGLAMQRTYNSDDGRIGPFGIGWTHAYDIRNQDESSQPITDETMNLSDRADFFGGTHKYHRDADGLYTPPVYLYDELNSDYDSFLVNGPIAVLADTETSMDGTVKHFIAGQSGGSTVNPERVCDYIQDRYGNTTNLAYNSVAMPDGSTKKLLSTVTDPSGRQIAYTWTNIGTQSQPAWRITQAQGPLYSVTYQYYTDPNHPESYQNLQSVTLDPTGVNRTTSFTYTSYTGTNGTENGLLASVTDPLAESVSYQYTLEANVTNTMWVTSVTEPGSGGNHVWTIGPAWTTIPTLTSGCTSNAGLQLQVESDTQLRCIDTSTAQAYAYQASYDTANNLTQEQEQGGSSNVYPFPYDGVSVYTRGKVATYGPHGNELTEYPLGYASQVTTTNWYNGSQYFQKQSVTDANGHTTTFGVGTNADPNVGNRGSVLWVQDAGYNDSHSPSYQKQYSYTYNSYGQKTSETNLNGTVTNYTYGDQWGNLTQVVQDPGSGSHLARTTTMSYDAAGHVLSSSDPNGRTSTFTFNNLDQPFTAAFPATASTPAETVSYAYDGNGRMHSVTDNRGTTTLSYESGNDRVHSVTDPVTGAITYTYGLAGERKSMILPGGGTFTYGYQANSFTILPKDDPNSANKWLNQITDDQGRIVNYRLDIRGRLHEVYWAQVFSGANLTSYCWTGLQEEQVNGNGYTHGWTAEVANVWVGNGQIVPHNPGPTRLLSQNDYTYDSVGQRLTNAIQLNGGSRTESYGYEDLNRLSSVNYGDGQTQSYTFDPMGNRLSRQDSVSGTDNYTYNAANMLLTRGSNSYTNDQNGNTLTGGGRTNTWDSENRLAQCVYNGNTSVYTYGYDGLRHRSAITTAGTTTTTDLVLDGPMFVREMRSGSNYATYLVGPRGPEYRRDDTAGTVRWYCYDGLGCVLGEVDPNGNLTASRSYDVYGSVRTSAGTSTSRHKFVGSLGHPSDDDTGLIYMQARYMDPVTGRFVSEDPARHGANWLLYCEDNPVNKVDRDGKDGAVVVIEIGLALIVLGMLSSYIFRAMLVALGHQMAYAEENLWIFIKGIFGVLGNWPVVQIQQSIRDGTLVKRYGPIGAAREVVGFYTGYTGLLLIAIGLIDLGVEKL